jgi:hypothetical protein
MDEAEWLACKDIGQMLDFLRGKATKRKFRLFVCVCCRRIWHLLPDERSRQAVEVSELYADGLAQRKVLVETRKQALVLARDSWSTPAENAACAAARPVLTTSWVAYLARTAMSGRKPPVDPEAEHEAQSVFLRCIFGNPFRPIALDPACRTPSVRALAQAAYDDRQLPAGTLNADRLAILADALEEAGAGPAVLGHLRGSGPHWRGCHVLDATLEKS